VAEQHLDHSDIDVLFQQVSGEAVPQGVERIKSGVAMNDLIGCRDVELLCRQRGRSDFEPLRRLFGGTVLGAGSPS
jgi:hypothetical protein